MSQSFIESRRIARIRPRAIRLFFPFLALAASSFVVSFYSGRLPEQWMNIALYSVAGAIALFPASAFAPKGEPAAADLAAPTPPADTPPRATIIVEP